MELPVDGDRILAGHGQEPLNHRLLVGPTGQPGIADDGQRLADKALESEIGLEPSQCGRRDVMVALNVTLDTQDIEVARTIAKAVRESEGGLTAVRALGFALESRNCVQVSMNLLDYKKTSPDYYFSGWKFSIHNGYQSVCL